jgi:hypothetical protein
LKRKDKSSVIRGIVQVEAGGVFFAHATEPGQVALDGLPGRSSHLGPRERNAEVRRIMIERCGWSRYIADSGAEVVVTIAMDHEFTGLRGARLLRKEVPGEPEPIV